MIRFNVVGVGFLDMERGGVSLKTESQWFRFADIGLGRTTEFTVPANLHNRRMLDWPEDPAGNGEAMRVTYDARMHYDGGAKEGLLEVRGWEKGSFRCVFYFGASKKLEAMLDRPLKDCATTLGGVTWSTSSALTDAANASADVELVKYDNYWGIGNTSIQIQPSVKVKAFCEDVLTQLGATHSIGVSGDLYMVSPTLNGGAEDTVGFTQTSVSSTSISQSEGYFSVQSLNLEWATKLFFGSYVGGGSVSSYGFKVVKKCSVTFDNTTPTGIFLVKWSDKLSQYDVLGGVDNDGTGDPHTSRGLGLYSEPLAGLTVQFEKGDVFFFADHKFFTNPPVHYGYQDLAHPVTVGATVTGTGAMVDGDKWHVKNNMPDMTLFEFLKSVALATGKELTVSCSFGIPHVKIGDAAYNSQSDVIALDRVTAVDGVSRVVGCWGEGTRYARLRFDSEDYVTENVESFYEVGNVQNEGEEEATAKFSEGGVSSAENGSVLIRDRKEASSSDSSARAWTLGWAGSHATGHSLLVRVTAPDFVGYADIASASTCLKVRCHMAVEDFIALKLENTFAWRGGVYVWTDASWSSGVASLTLQKVSMTVGGGTDPADVRNYVQDGLVLHLDGKNKGNVADHWISLVGGYDYSPYGSPTFHDDCVEFDGVGDYFRNNSFIMPEVASGTIEVVYDADNQASAQCLISSKSDVNRMVFGWMSNGLMVWSSKTSGKRYSVPLKASVTVNADRCLANGNALTNTGTSYFPMPSSAGSRVGCRIYSSTNQSFYKGKIYSIRVYNRKLTEAEMRNNLAVDVQRFGISI